MGAGNIGSRKGPLKNPVERTKSKIESFAKVRGFEKALRFREEPIFFFVSF